MEQEHDSILPPLNYHGCLPEGVHDCALEQLRERFATNPKRVQLWERLQEFLRWALSTGQFSHAYIDGGFITNKSLPEDIDVILQTRARYGPEAFCAMEPFFAEGLEKIFEKYSVHLHFWCEGFPGGLSDFRRFFQYLRPQDSSNSRIREAVSSPLAKGEPGLISAFIQFEVARSLLEGALANDDFVNAPNTYAEGTTGCCLHRLIHGVFDSEPLISIQERMKQSPSEFLAEVQSALKPFKAA